MVLHPFFQIFQLYIDQILCGGPALFHHNPDRLIGSTGRDSLTWANTELYVWMMNDAGVAEQLDI